MSERVDVLAVLDMALLYVEETHEIHPGDFKPGVGKKNTNDIKKARAAVAELIERLEASNWRLSNLLALIPEGRPERAQIEQDMADNRAALARVGGAS